MKIKCEYCDSMFDDTLEKCPSCGAPNKNVRRSTSDQPTTIEGLKEWYASKGLPPEDVTRFFIGKDYRGAKAFGIYKDESTGNFIVYKNKADGSRAVRYEGTDEAYAVNELHTRLKQEILEQKSHNISKGSAPASYNRGGGRRRKKKSCLSSILGFIIPLILCIGVFKFLVDSETPAKSGYYMYNDEAYYQDKLFYHYGSDGNGWAVYDDEIGDWKKTSSYPVKLELQSKAKNYFLSSDYDPKYGKSDFKDSMVYEDYLHGFIVNEGYYSYNDEIYYHMKPDQDQGWYVYNTDDDEWNSVFLAEIPSDLKHQNVANDFWYTPDWDTETQITDFEDTDYYIDYQDELYRESTYESSSSSSYDSDDSDYSWSSSDSWDSGGSDWDSDW